MRFQLPIVLAAVMAFCIPMEAFSMTVKDYLQELEVKVGKNWSQRTLRPNNSIKMPVINFTVSDDGLIRNLRITTSSNDAVLDQSLLKAVQRSSPFGNTPVPNLKIQITGNPSATKDLKIERRLLSEKPVGFNKEKALEIWGEPEDTSKNQPGKETWVYGRSSLSFQSEIVTDYVDNGELQIRKPR